MPARLEVRTAEDNEWVALVGGNGETMMVTELYPTGHGNGDRSKERLEAVFAELALEHRGEE